MNDYLKGMVKDIPVWEYSPGNNGKPHWFDPAEGSSFWVPRNWGPPAVGDRVRILAWDGILGTVVGYQVCAPGYLMIWVKPDERPDWHYRQNPDRYHCLLAGIEMEPV